MRRPAGTDGREPPSRARSRQTAGQYCAIAGAILAVLGAGTLVVGTPDFIEPDTPPTRTVGLVLLIVGGALSVVAVVLLGSRAEADKPPRQAAADRLTRAEGAPTECQVVPAPDGQCASARPNAVSAASLLVSFVCLLVVAARCNFQHVDPTKCEISDCSEPGQPCSYRCSRCGNTFYFRLCSAHTTYRQDYAHACNLMRMIHYSNQVARPMR